jgi:hypothetical protein
LYYYFLISKDPPLKTPYKSTTYEIFFDVAHGLLYINQPNVHPSSIPEIQMKSVSKSLATLALAATALVSLQAQAVVITFGGQNMNTATGDKSGLTSNFAPVDNKTIIGSGFYGETFDVATANALLGTPMTDAKPDANQKISIQQGNGCSINSWASVGVSVTGGGFSVRKGTAVNPGGAATPAGDSTCFGFGPEIGGTLPATTKVDYSNLLAGLSAASYGATFKISYLGVYYGSIDNYNNIAFYSGANLLKANSGFLDNGILEGAEILQELGGSTGNQVSDKSNVYVNLAFAPSEFFTGFEFRTTGVAFELDNIWVGVTQIPEPASLALVGLGLVGVAAARRRKQAK